MRGRRAIASLWFGTAVLSGGCTALAPQGSSPASSDLRELVMETRRDLDELRRDQERLRGQVEYLQHASTSRAAAVTTPPSPVMPATPYPSSVAAPVDAAAPAVTTPSGESAMAGVSPGAPPVGEAAPPPPAGTPTPMSDPIIAAVHGGGGGTMPGDVPMNESPTVPTELRGSGYDDAVRSFVEEQYDDAIQYFRDFIAGNSTSPYADDAQYWIGESYLRKGVYQNAIKEFNQVVLRYGSGDRSAPALLKLAKIFSKIGDQVDARLSLQKLVNRYPGTPEAAEATGLLQQMGG
jgi:tol-pal system protein YbgF